MIRMVFKRRAKNSEFNERSPTVYVAGGYPKKNLVKDTVYELSQLTKITITFPWWNVTKDEDGVRAASYELTALKWSEYLIVLDAHAGTGTSFEMGYFMGLNRGKMLVWVTLDGNEPKLNWFGSSLKEGLVDTTVGFKHISVPVWKSACIASSLVGP